METKDPVKEELSKLYKEVKAMKEPGDSIYVEKYNETLDKVAYLILEHIYKHALED